MYVSKYTFRQKDNKLIGRSIDRQKDRQRYLISNEI